MSSSSIIDQIKRSGAELKALWNKLPQEKVNQNAHTPVLSNEIKAHRSVHDSIEQVVRSLEEATSTTSPSFSKLSPSELLKTVGYELWNQCVEQNAKKFLVSLNLDELLKLQLIRVRKVACHVIEKSLKPSTLTLKVIHNMMRLYAKTARDYLVLKKSNTSTTASPHKLLKKKGAPARDEDGDIEFEDAISSATASNANKEYELALVCFDKAAVYADKYMNAAISSENSSSLDSSAIMSDEPLDKSTDSALSAILNVCIDRADCLYRSNNVQGSFAAIQQGKKLIHKLPHEIQRIAMIEYNYAVDLNGQLRYEETIPWLKDSFELYELVAEGKSLQKQSRTLRLLSNSYLETGNLENGLNCITMANNMCKTPQGIFLEVKFYAILRREEQAERSLLELIRLPEAGLDLAIAACKEVFQAKMMEITAKAYKLLLELHASTEQEPRILMRYFDFLVNSSETSSLSDEIENIVKRLLALNQRYQTSTMMKATMKEFQCTLWNIAWKHFQKKEYASALSFYNQSLQILPMDDLVDRAKVLRSMARCHLEEGKTYEAHSCAESAEQLDPKSLHTHYLMYQISIRMKNIESAKNYLKLMMQDEDFQSLFFAIAAQDAYKEGIHEVAIDALEGLLKENQKDKRLSLERGQILRTLTYLAVLIKDRSSVLKYLQRTMQDFQTEGTSNLFSTEHEESEIEWFHRVAWNSAGECVHENQVEMAFEFYRLAYLFYTYRNASLETLTTQKYCYLMRIYCAVEVTRRSDEYANGAQLTQKNREILQKALDDTQSCKKLLQLLARDYQSMDSNRDKIYPLVHLAEIQLLTMLGCDEALVIDVINATLKLDSITGPGVYEMIASICCSADSNGNTYHAAAKYALQMALKKILHGTSTNYSKALSLYTLIIQICNSREESYTVFEEVLKLLNQIKPSEQFVQSEHNTFVWFCTESWNNGVYYYKLLKNDKAQEWMKLSVKLCCYLSAEEEVVKTITERYAIAFEKLSN
ncbi:hypothetical protein C9374_004070 [Naegleria lovaniensis]|uniref:Protein ZIP4 homolog n=1 Tax=Naegleria lovaniensis TaxID=51637 RepID=A0AA88GLY2_NAELO|nr:uncharacterized protein C9374_004070 [Naegleria lovaniensis]KAG2383399.1 hypothetical protein C9374_004070 [Naegleria lovaniensis]